MTRREDVCVNSIALLMWIGALCLYIAQDGAALAQVSASDERSDPRVRVATGELVGIREGDIHEFRGIPFAAPPVGALRWAPPRPPAPWHGVRRADQFGAPCTQPDFARIAEGKRVSGEGFDLFIGVPMLPKSHEDCLTLNVWSRAGVRSAPVMVFIYGASGSADVPWWNGRAFARDDIVLVTFNYRNLTMGKFAHPAVTRAAARNEPLGRYDLMDQIAALQWVRENIRAFGGDPENVTLFGQSAGGSATLQLLTVPSARGLFHKAIVQSGNGWWTPANQGENEQIGSLLAAQVGLPGAHATIEELRSLAPDAMPWIGFFNFDGRLVAESPTAAFAAAHVTDVPLMIGWNSFDGSSLRFGASAVLKKTSLTVKAAYAADRMSDDDLAYALYTDSHVGAPARWIAKRTASGAPTYLYYFSYVRAADRSNVRGAAHGAELPYVFDSWREAAPGLKLTAEEEAVTRLVHSCWVTFAKNGEPRCDGAPTWPRYTSSDDKLMELGNTAAVRQNFRKAQLDAQEAAMPDVLAAQRAALDTLLEGRWAVRN
jgi:para-nitrobenzyl esterase